MWISSTSTYAQSRSEPAENPLMEQADEEILPGEEPLPKGVIAPTLDAMGTGMQHPRRNPPPIDPLGIDPDVNLVSVSVNLVSVTLRIN